MRFTVILFILIGQVFGQSISRQSSLAYLLDNFEPAGTASGILVASPSRSNPDYFYHWVRDAALVMSTLVDIVIDGKSSSESSLLVTKIESYIDRVRQIQTASGFSNLGEPKYNVDGSPFTGPWGRPQHDGPALRAVTLIKFANYKLDQGDIKYVKENLYGGELPAKGPIKIDLEYTARHWNEQGFDYWEEVMGLNFSTAMSQRRALIEGAKLARRLGDFGAADFYESSVGQVEKLINKFWSSSKGFIQATIYQTRGVSKSQLDISTILGVNHSYNNDGFYAHTDKRVLSTILKLENTYQKLYSINNRTDMGPSIGRYPEDKYDGYGTNGEGHGWFLAVFGMAEFHLRLRDELKENFVLTNSSFYCSLLAMPRSCLLSELRLKRSEILSALKAKAIKYFNRANFHAGTSGRMSEQMNRHTGHMEGATNLTWSYASHLSALRFL